VVRGLPISPRRQHQWAGGLPADRTGPGSQTDSAAPGSPVTAVWSDRDHLDLFVTGADGKVMTTYWEYAKNWQPWFPI
jgi:hypothetical protein